MATAKKRTTEIHTFELSLSKEEADTLHDLIYAGVAGAPNTRRKHLASIRAALTKAGVREKDSRTHDLSGIVTFE